MPRTYSPTNRTELAAQILRQSAGRIFGATVRKRDGTIREFNARTCADSFNEKNVRNGQVLVIDVKKIEQADDPQSLARAYRTIALEGVKSLRVDGKVYDFDA